MIAAISARRDCTIGQIRLAPPVPHQAAKMNIICQAKGLKYQVEPGGYEAKFQSKMRAKI